MTDPFSGQPAQPAAALTVRPKSVDTSFMLWLAASASGIVAMLLNFATAGDFARELAREELEKAGLSLESLDNMDTVASAGIGAAAVVGVLMVIAWIFVAFQMRNGKTWARIVLAVLGGLAALFGLIALFDIGILFSVGALGVVQGLLGLIQLAAIIGAVVFMFKADANAYFQRV